MKGGGGGVKPLLLILILKIFLEGERNVLGEISFVRVKENHIGSMVTKILTLNIHTHIHS